MPSGHHHVVFGKGGGVRDGCTACCATDMGGSMDNVLTIGSIFDTKDNVLTTGPIFDTRVWSRLLSGQAGSLKWTICAVAAIAPLRRATARGVVCTLL